MSRLRIRSAARRRSASLGGPSGPVPVNTVAPVVTGQFYVGQLLTTTNGTWSNSPTGYTYQWRKDGVPISGATSNTFLLTIAEVDAYVDCRVTATNVNGSTSTNSNGATVSATPTYAFANLAALFNGGAIDGVMIDLTNKDTLFQDANGAAAVVNNGDPVGLALDQHKWGGLTLAAYRAAQAEKIADADFSVGALTGWGSQFVASMSVVAGKLRVEGSSAARSRAAAPAAAVTANRWCELSIDITSSTSGSGPFGIQIGTTQGGTDIYNGTVSTTGMHRRLVKPSGTSVYVTVEGRAGAGIVTEFDLVSLKEIDGHHATQTSTARPTWASATGDVLFDGTNDYLTTNDFYFQDFNDHMAAWAAFGASGANRMVMGAANTSPSEIAHIFAGTSGVLNVRGGTAIVTGPNVANTTKTVLVDQRSADLQLLVDAGTPVSGVSSAMPDAVRARPLFIGAQNDNGTPSAYFNGNIKRIVAGQVRVQDTMTAADFHENLIA